MVPDRRRVPTPRAEGEARHDHSEAGIIHRSGNAGVVRSPRAIHVRDGQQVGAGEALIELDSTMNDAESKHFYGDLLTAELDMARLTAALAPEGDPLAAFHPPKDANADMVSMQRQLLRHQLEEYRAKLAALESPVRLDGLLEADGDEEADGDGGEVNPEVFPGVGWVGHMDVDHGCVLILRNLYGLRGVGGHRDWVVL